MALLLIGFGGGVVIGFVLCAMRAGQQFDEGYRLGMEVGQSTARDTSAYTIGFMSSDGVVWPSGSIAVIGDDPAVECRARWYVKPPDGDWLPTTEAVARSVEDDGWRVAEVEK